MSKIVSISNEPAYQKAFTPRFGENKPSSFFKPFIQPKLAINPPNDKYEQEADAVADKLMRTTDSDRVQAKFFKPSVSVMQRKCPGCEEERKMQREEANSDKTVASNGLENYVDNLTNNGRPLPDEVRSFYEPRFGYDFSSVKVHTNAEAARSAQSINALAYTSGNHVVFNEGQYAPGTETGKRLLAHELVHVRQQTAARIQTTKIPGSAYTYNDVNGIQRKVSADFSSMKDNLSKGSAGAHKVLLILKHLNANDLRDTVAAMERNNIVDTFFKNLSREDAANEVDFLQHVQNNRTHSATYENGNTSVTVSSTFSCTIKQGDLLHSSMTTAKSWLDTAIGSLEAYIAAPGAPGMADIRDALQTHVHTLEPAHIKLLLSRLEDFRYQMFDSNNIEVECATPVDGLCKEIADAYEVPDESPKKLRFCPSLFSEAETSRTEVMIHEAMHALFSNSTSGEGTVTDRGYAQERVYEFLSAEEAFDNSDSIAMLVEVLAKGQALTSWQMNRPHDDFSDCSRKQLDILHPTIARAARLNLNSISILAYTDADFRKGYAGLRRQYFGSDKVEKIPELLETYQQAQTKFEDNLSIDCETAGGACSPDTTGYYRSFIFKSGTLHVCPEFFAIAKDDDRIKAFLSLAIMNSAEKSDADSAKYADFAKALTDMYGHIPPPLPH